MLKTVFRAATEKASKRLMVVLHGLGDSTNGYEWLPSTLELPWMNYLLVNAPDQYYEGYSWYDFEGAPKDQRTGIERSRKLLGELLDTQEKIGFPAAQTVLFGFSQGCLMTVDVGFRYPSVLAGLVGISGYVFEPDLLLRELSPVARQQEMLFTHGSRDPLIRCAMVREQVNQLKAAGLRIDWHEYPKEHTIAGMEELGLIRRFVLDCYSQSR